MSSLFFITLNNQVLNTRIKSRTCLIGITEKPTAKRIKKVFNDPKIEISEIDYMKDEFYEMLKLNQFTLMVTTDVTFNNEGFELGGDVIDSPDVSQDELSSHFEKLYVQDCPKE